jgi:sporulation protein YlmC with PRC-barrel domain
MMVAAGVALAGYEVQAQQPGATPRGTQAAGQGPAVEASQTYRAEKLQGMKVRNPEGEELGTIEDLVIDMESHRVRYAALAYGGFLGVGDKLFAIPIEALRLKHEGEKSHFVVDVDKETLHSAPGFSKKAWPDFADPAWMAGMEKHYGRYGVLEGTVHSTRGGKLLVEDRTGQRQQFNIGPNVKVVADGDSADLSDLHAGQMVRITTSERDGKRVAMSVEARGERTARQPSPRPIQR